MFRVYLFHRLNFYGGFRYCTIAPLIVIPGHYLYFPHVYGKSYIFEKLIKNVDCYLQ